MPPTIKNLIGFHGTDLKNLKVIKKDGFESSQGDEHWLGEGIYFFTEGITGDPKIDARNWAIAHAWDNNLKLNKYSNYVILFALINVNEDLLLDLTTKDGMDVFNYVRQKYIDKIKAGGWKLKSGQDFEDGHIINDARNSLKITIDVVKANFYIKFAVERKYSINFRIPNTTILSVYNTKCIESASIREVDKGVVI